MLFRNMPHLKLPVLKLGHQYTMTFEQYSDLGTDASEPGKLFFVLLCRELIAK